MPDPRPARGAEKRQLEWDKEGTRPVPKVDPEKSDVIIARRFFDPPSRDVTNGQRFFVGMIILAAITIVVTLGLLVEI